MKSMLHPGAIRILVPCHNCSDYIAACLQSIQDQSFENYTVTVLVDKSNDATTDEVKPFLRDSRFSLIAHTARQYLMGNLAYGFRELRAEPNDIVVIVDGDDFLLPGALKSVWEEHAKGYDFVYTDMLVSDSSKSIGRPILPGVPIRSQNWCVSHLRSFKAYLLEELSDDLFQDENGNYFRAAGDMSWIMPMIERAGSYKTRFIPRKLYHYRVHDRCNCKVRRTEQLANNKLIRSRPPLPPQTRWFDYHLAIDEPGKTELRETAEAIRNSIPLPFSVRLYYEPDEAQGDSWDAYSGLWIAKGVFFEVMSKA